ncbi:MAG: hypothetical protein ACRDY3_10975 [Acidimicrobiales bacterium]
MCAAVVPSGEAEAPPSGTSRTLIAYADDHLVAVIEHGMPGVLVAPRAHVEGLAMAPGEGGIVLGALRRAASTVRSCFGADGTTIEPTTELPGAPGHVCYRVVCTRGGVPFLPGSYPDVDPDVLALALSRVWAPSRLSPG